MFGKYKNIGILAHDAGSANIILEWIKTYKNYNYYIKVTGPAKKIFKNKIRNKKLNLSLKKIMKHSQFIVSGTSANNIFEHLARNMAIKKKYPVRVFQIIGFCLKKVFCLKIK